MLAQECLNSLIRAIGLGMSGDQLPLFSNVEVDEIIISANNLDDLPIDILVEELGEDLLTRLKLARIEKFGELANLSRIVSEFIHYLLIHR